ncbi:MAG TPA: V-type ATP synthase subunit E family protein [Candidatus Anoxymicrobiaceae bacterium]
MALEDILKALEEKAEAREAAIELEAKQRVNEILAEVDKDAARTKRMRLKKVEDQIRSEATGIVYSAQLKAKNQLIKAQEETVDEAFKKAEQRLKDLGKQQDYPQVLEVLLDECLDFFPEGEVLVQVRPDDRDLLEKMLAGRGRSFRISDTPLAASGGLVVSSPDGQIVVSNTFESRLERARDHLRLEISKSLFGAEA